MQPCVTECKNQICPARRIGIVLILYNDVGITAADTIWRCLQTRQGLNMEWQVRYKPWILPAEQHIFPGQSQDLVKKLPALNWLCRCAKVFADTPTGLNSHTKQRNMQEEWTEWAYNNKTRMRYGPTPFLAMTEPGPPSLSLLWQGKKTQ